MATMADINAKFAELYPEPAAASWADDDDDNHGHDDGQDEEDLYDEDGFLITNDEEEEDDDDDDDASTASATPPQSPPSSVDGDDDEDDLTAFFLAGYDIECPEGYRHPAGTGRSVFDGWEGISLPAIDEEDEDEYNLPPAKPISDHFLGSLCFTVGHWASQLLGL